MVTTEADLAQLTRRHLRVASRSRGVASLEISADALAATSSRSSRSRRRCSSTALNRGATDIHVEPEEKVTRVRYRIDGILQQGENLPRAVTDAITSRIKILANLDISERRRPQDGRLRVRVDDRSVDMRVSIMPSADGENVVLRILDRGAVALRLAELGISPRLLGLLRKVKERPHGLFLVTGPTGSGKTTTLYSMLAEMDAVHDNIATIEDPVEYRLPLVRQSQVDPSIGFGFQEGLRSLLRQDPDVILVGEIRDKETAEMAIKASMTGPPRLLDAPHQHRDRRHPAPDRPRRRPVPRRGLVDRRARPAARPQRVRRLRPVGAPHAGGADLARRAGGESATRRRLPSLSRFGLPRTVGVERAVPAR
jgi:type II secretory ATPase GspE/PulE/Tfp pilus assembly ATPase PilB-like protein